jgi:dTDP-4-amino-4,6-dideoxygalactose transaminase
LHQDLVLKVRRFRPKRILDELGDLVTTAIDRSLRSGQFIGGPEVSNFEDRCARYLGVEYAVSCGSGTDALELALRALWLPPGSNIAVAPLTFSATCSAIVAAGLRPLFVDTDPVTLQISSDALESALPRVSAVVPVSLYGRPLDSKVFELCEAAGVPVVEDACQSFGAGPPDNRVGSQATLTAFSFFPTKPLGALGDGGVVTTSIHDLATTVRALAHHGCHAHKSRPWRPGRNSRLDALQAAILTTKLDRVDDWRSLRETQARRYHEALGDCATLPAWSPHHAWHIYAIRTHDRDRWLRELREHGIDAAVYYPMPLHHTPAFGTEDFLPHAEAACKDLLCLPISATLWDAEQRYVIDTIRDIANNSARTTAETGP